MKQEIKCKICDEKCTSNISLVKHLKYTHGMTSQDYYDTYIKKNTEGFCLTCGKPTRYISISTGYANYCNATCSHASGENSFRSKGIRTIEQKNNCTLKSTLIDKYGYYIVNKVPETIIGKTAFINNKYLPQLNEELNNCEFKCKICNKGYKSQQALSGHLLQEHNISSKEYYDSFLKKDKNEGICVSCGRPTRFAGFKKGYLKHCSHLCNNQDTEFRKRVSKTIKSDKWQQDYKNKMLKKYGVDSFSKTDEFKEKFNITFNSNIEKFEKENNCTLLYKLIEEYGQGWYTKGIGRRIKNGWNIFILNEDIDEIKKYSSTDNVSTFEVDIVEFIKSIYDKEIIRNTRKVIKPLELDIYIPNKNLAIEINGIHWHSTNVGLPKNYHLNKTDLCNDKNIRLIHLFDIEWISKKEICKSLIASALGIYDRKIYARACEVKEVDSAEAKNFLEENHIQGFVNSSYRLGLYYKDELVQLIAIGKSRFKKDEYELYRMCTKLNTQVIGGFSKLLKYQPYNSLISYVDRSKFSGDGYFNSNWILIGTTPVSYFYYNRKFGKLNRMQCQKHKLIKLLGDKFDSSKTEQQNMIDNEFYQVYDCGNLKLQFNK